MGSDPPLGGVPDFTASIPTLTSASERWSKGGGSLGLIKILKTGENAHALQTLIRTTGFMIGVPASVMLIAYMLVLDQLFVFKSAGDKMLYAGIAGIVAVQIVIGGFIAYAFSDTNEADADAPAADKKRD